MVMPQFLFLGQRWVNVDKITSVEVHKDSVTTNPFCVVLYGTSGKIILDETESKELTKWLAANRVKND